MTTHNRFDEKHRSVCADCCDAYLDFLQEQEDETRLDNQGEQNDENDN